MRRGAPRERARPPAAGGAARLPRTPTDHDRALLGSGAGDGSTRATTNPPRTTCGGPLQRSPRRKTHSTSSRHDRVPATRPLTRRRRQPAHAEPRQQQTTRAAWPLGHRCRHHPSKINTRSAHSSGITSDNSCCQGPRGRLHPFDEPPNASPRALRAHINQLSRAAIVTRNPWDARAGPRPRDELNAPDSRSRQRRGRRRRRPKLAQQSSRCRLVRRRSLLHRSPICPGPGGRRLSNG